MLYIEHYSGNPGKYQDMEDNSHTNLHGKILMYTWYIEMGNLHTICILENI